MRPGDPLDVAQRVAEDYVFSRFPREQVWWVGGYALGIAMPPNWVGHTYLANDAFEQFTWEPGYVTNYENVLFDRDAGFTASYMETLLMTEAGIEVLSDAAAHAHRARRHGVASASPPTGARPAAGTHGSVDTVSRWRSGWRVPTRPEVLGAALADALGDDPVFRWLIPASPRRDQRLLSYFTAMSSSYLASGQACLSRRRGRRRCTLVRPRHEMAAAIRSRSAPCGLRVVRPQSRRTSSAHADRSSRSCIPANRIGISVTSACAAHGRARAWAARCSTRS